MRILDRYIVREIFRHAFLGLVVFTFVLFVPQLVRLMELLVRHSGSGAQITKLFLYIFPGVLIFTIPMAVLVGVLLGLGRMSADSEIIALTALGISRQRMLVPVGVLALTGAIATGTLTLWLAPAAFRALRGIEADLLASQASFQVQPRVFDERFPKRVLYINDVSASGTQWHGVFLAEVGEESGSQLTLAENAIVIAEPKQGKLELHLQGGTTHEVSRKDPDHYSVTDFGQSDWPLEVTGLISNQQRALSNSERRTMDLLAENGKNWREARVEFQRRLAFPFAWLVFALVGVPTACGTADWFVLLAFASGCGVRPRGEVESMDGYLAGEPRVDGACHHIAAAHGTVAGRQRVVPKNQSAGNVEETAASQENASQEAGGGAGESIQRRAAEAANFGGQLSTLDRSVSASAIPGIFRPANAGVRVSVSRVHIFRVVG